MWRNVLNSRYKKGIPGNYDSGGRAAHLNCSGRLTLLIGRGGVDGRGQQGRSEEHVQALVPVRGAGEEDDCLAQERFFWSDGAVRLTCC